MGQAVMDQPASDAKEAMNVLSYNNEYLQRGGC